MNNGLIFNGEGPMMSGTWYNPSNGDSFTVADSFFQDNQYIVKTTDGRMLDYNFIQHYIKSDKPIPKQETSKPSTLNLPPEVASIIEEDSSILSVDLDLINGAQSRPLGNLNQTTSTNTHIIEKALTKKPIPNLRIYVDWDSYPKKELEMLFEIMDIDMDEVLNWYLEKMDLSFIKKSIKESLANYINKYTAPEEEEAFVPYMCTESTIDGIASKETQKIKSKKKVSVKKTKK